MRSSCDRPAIVLRRHLACARPTATIDTLESDCYPEPASCSATARRLHVQVHLRLHGQRQRRPRREDRSVLGATARCLPHDALLRRRGLRRDQRERSRRRRVRDPTDVCARERQLDGVVGDGRRAQARVRCGDHRGRSLLRVCATGSEVGTAHPHHGEARRRPDERKRDQSRGVDGPPRESDPGLLQRALRSPLRDAGVPRSHAPALRGRAARDGLAGRGRRRADACVREADANGPRDHRQAAPNRERVRDHEHHR